MKWVLGFIILVIMLVVPMAGFAFAIKLLCLLAGFGHLSFLQAFAVLVIGETIIGAYFVFIMTINKLSAYSPDAIKSRIIGRT